MLVILFNYFYFIFQFAYELLVNVTGIFSCFSLLRVIFMFHLPYMDVYLNLYIKNQSYICIYMWILFEIGRLKIKVDIYVGKVKHKNK
jgi:hypothetical protein